MTEELNQWHVRETNVDGDATKWPKENREDAISGYEEFKDNWDADLEVVDPEGRIVKSQAEKDTDASEESEIVEEAQAIVEPEEPDSDETDNSKKERMAEGYKERNDIEPAPGGENAPTPTENNIPEPSQLTSDPLDVISKNADQFTDNIKGKTTINRQGYAVLAERFNIEVEAHPVTLPSETDFEYAEFRAVAETEDGQRYSGFGSAHINRDDGDDPHLLAELAETRAMKRSTAWATGVGMTAMSELSNTLPGE